MGDPSADVTTWATCAEVASPTVDSDENRMVAVDCTSGPLVGGAVHIKTTASAHGLAIAEVRVRTIGYKGEEALF